MLITKHHIREPLTKLNTATVFAMQSRQKSHTKSMKEPRRARLDEIVVQPTQTRQGLIQKFRYQIFAWLQCWSRPAALNGVPNDP